MPMLNKNDLNSVGLDTIRVSRNPTTVSTANGEVQTNEEATVYFYDLDTPAVLSLGKTLRRSRIFLRVGQWSKTTP